MCYTVEKGIITDCRNLPNMGVTSHDAAQLVKDLGFDALIAGGIDMDMANELCYAGIEVVAGVEDRLRRYRTAIENGDRETLYAMLSTASTRKKQIDLERARGDDVRPAF